MTAVLKAARRRKKSTQPNIQWSTAGLIYCFARRKQRSLLITITPPLPISNGQWSVVAVETGLALSQQSVFEDHAHKTIGDFPSIQSATVAAEDFARQWATGIDLDKCACGEIEFDSIGDSDPEWPSVPSDAPTPVVTPLRRPKCTNCGAELLPNGQCPSPSVDCADVAALR